MVKELEHLPHEERLRELELSSLEKVQGRLIHVCKRLMGGNEEGGELS